MVQVNKQAPNKREARERKKKKTERKRGKGSMKGKGKKTRKDRERRGREGQPLRFALCAFGWANCDVGQLGVVGLPDNWSIGHAQENDMRNNQHQSSHKVLCSGPKQQLKCITLQSLAQLVVPPCCCPTKKPTQVENRPHHHQHETVWLWSGWVADAGVAQKPNGKPPSSSTPTTDSHNHNAHNAQTHKNKRACALQKKH